MRSGIEIGATKISQQVPVGWFNKAATQGDAEKALGELKGRLELA
jgi:hypothetical protein